MDGTLWKLTADTLEPVWDEPFDVSAGLLTDPVLGGESVVVVGGIGAELFGVDAATGDEAWSVSGGNWFWGTPAADGAAIYATTLDGEVIAVDPATGDELWSQETEDPVRAGAVVVDGTVVTVDKGGRVYRFSPDGEAIGEPIRLDKTVYATPHAGDDFVIVLSTGGDLYTISTADGRTTKVVD
jgi:outer membrane protein assembly factor BamB